MEKGDAYDQSTLYTYMKIKQWNRLQIVSKLGERKQENIRGDDFNQNTLYACLDLPQWSHFAQLIYTNFKKELSQFLFFLLGEGL
jgi:hypothetical protein